MHIATATLDNTGSHSCCFAPRRGYLLNPPGPVGMLMLPPSSNDPAR
jgi:hypothetical protein